MHLDGRLEQEYTYDDIKNILEKSDNNLYQRLKQKYLLPVLTFKLEDNRQAFSPDGKMRVTVDRENQGNVSICNSDGSLCKTFQADETEITTVRFSSDSKMIATESSTGKLKLWKLDGTLYKSLKGHTEQINALDFRSDGEIIVAASNDKTVKLRKRDGKWLTLHGHQSVVWDVSISPDKDMIATASNDETVKLWDEEGKLLRTFKGHNDVVRAVAFSHDGNILASASDDGTVKLWCIKSKGSWCQKEAQEQEQESLKILKHSFDKLHGVVFNPENKEILTARGYGDVTFWNQDGTYRDTDKWHDGRINTFKLSPDGKLIVSADESGTVKLYTVESSHNKDLKVEWEDKLKNNVSAVSFSHKNQIFVTGYTTGKIKIWKRKQDGSLLERESISAHKKQVSGLSFSPDGKVFASGSLDGTVKLWKQDEDGSFKEIPLDNDKLEVSRVAFSPVTEPDKQIIAAVINQEITPETCQETDNLLNRHSWKLKLNNLVTGVSGKLSEMSNTDSKSKPKTYQRIIRLWKIDGTELTTFRAHCDFVNAIAFSRDGKSIATASNDKTVRVWKTSDDWKTNNWKEKPTIFYGHNDSVIGLAFSPDGNKIASASEDKTVLLWNIRIKQELPELRKRACDWMEDYLKNNTNPELKDSDRKLCDRHLQKRGNRE
ncbi:MAG: WD40 repeat domain-containing protein [Okeania sp. SIO3C4]|nr:WD40 repeat domain-containing protein [Okeania sp. SIO3C4]